MPILTLTFPTPLNTSVQIGDVGYFVEVTTFTISSTNPDDINTIDFDSNYTNPNTAPIQEIGSIVKIIVQNQNQTDVLFNINGWENVPGGTLLINQIDINLNQYFIMFAKNNAVNLSSVLGYYAKARFVNNSMNRAELFSVGSEVQQSSK